MGKKMLKEVLDKVMAVASLPVYLLFCIMALLAGRRKAFASVMQGVSLLPGISGEWFRRGVLKWVTGQGLKDACICFGTLFSDPDLQLGDGIYIGPRCDLGRVIIGKNTIMGSNVQVLSGLRQHRFDDPGIPIKDQSGCFEKVSIGEDCWIGNGALICADIGNRCVIGAGSLVVKAVPNHSIVRGHSIQNTTLPDK